LASQHIRQSAVVVMDNLTGEVRALVGSRDYDDVESEGQVNGALASRSPGSTLKPFLYALAMDRGMVTPRSLLEDVPASYDGYQPSNFDGAFSGVVKARDALARSLNVPAVVLNQRLGPDGLYTLLARSRVRGLNPDPFYYGLPIVLGACETSLMELCELYACLARGGLFRKASFVAGRPGESLDRFFSAGASYLTSDILSDVQRPDFPENWQDRTNAPKIAWKTGTSYGYKDAWSVGYNSKYTVGVWTGNFDGAGDQQLVGSRAAADPGDWFRCPEEVGTRAVCALSGDCPGEDCPETVQDFYLRNVSSVQPCGLHQSRWVDALTGRLLCDACRPGREARSKVFEIWPAHVATWLKKADYPLPVLPRHYANCQRLEDGSGPRIHSPEHLSQYSLRTGIPRQEQKIALIASSYSNVQKVYWLVDGRLQGSGSPQQKFFYVPVPGKHRVVCMDDAGRSSISEITILQ
jgi:penicillin-binding protein 1C